MHKDPHRRVQIDAEVTADVEYPVLHVAYTGNHYCSIHAGYELLEQPTQAQVLGVVPTAKREKKVTQAVPTTKANLDTAIKTKTKSSKVATDFTTIKCKLNQLCPLEPIVEEIKRSRFV